MRIVSTSERETILHGRLVQQHKEDSKCVLLSIVHDSFLLERSVGTPLKGKEWKRWSGLDATTRRKEKNASNQNQSLPHFPFFGQMCGQERGSDQGKDVIGASWARSHTVSLGLAEELCGETDGRWPAST